jgi:hypothetical protein
MGRASPDRLAPPQTMLTVLTVLMQRNFAAVVMNHRRSPRD